MTEEPISSRRQVTAQIGHVCMVDRVGFSLLSLNEQSTLVEELRSFVRTIPAYLEAEAEESVIPLDTGDGLALVFLGDPQLAGEAALALRDYSLGQSVKLRIGLGSGPVTLRTDLAGHPNASGPGIDLTQRVMSVADPSSVMISRSMADNLLAFDAWRPLIQEAGSFTVKHEQELFLYRFQGASGEGAEAPPSPNSATSAPHAQPLSSPASALSSEPKFVISLKAVLAICAVFGALVLAVIFAGIRAQGARVAELSAAKREGKIDNLTELIRSAQGIGPAEAPTPPGFKGVSEKEMNLDPKTAEMVRKAQKLAAEMKFDIPTPGVPIPGDPTLRASSSGATGSGEPKQPVPPSVQRKSGSRMERMPVSVRFRNTNVRVALRMIFSQIKAPFTIDSAVAGTVTLEQIRAPVGEVLRNSLAQVGASYKLTGSKFHVFMTEESSDDTLDPYAFLDDSSS